MFTLLILLWHKKTGHAEVVRVVYQPEHISFEELLKVFWENHDPTQVCEVSNPLHYELVMACGLSIDHGALQPWIENSDTGSQNYPFLLTTGFLTGMRQGNDYGTQYRSAVYPTSKAQMETALRSKEEYQKTQQPMLHVLQERSRSEGGMKLCNELRIVLLQLSKRKPDL
ncbi:methionine sulfoxide reductase A [Cricetulus griseus]